MNDLADAIVIIVVILCRFSSLEQVLKVWFFYPFISLGVFFPTRKIFLSNGMNLFPVFEIKTMMITRGAENWYPWYPGYQTDGHW